MARINLLPWREERRKVRQRDFASKLGLAALIGLFLSVVVVIGVKYQLANQNARNQFLRSEIATVEEQLIEIEQLDKERERLLARKMVIDELQVNRLQMVHLFDSLAKTIPDGVILNSIKQEGHKLTLEGRSQSSAQVSEFMRQLETSGWMKSPEVVIIEAKSASTASRAPVLQSAANLPYMFTLTVTIANPGSEAVTSSSVAVESAVVEVPSSVPVDSMTSEVGPVVSNDPVAQIQVASDGAPAAASSEEPTANSATDTASEEPAASVNGNEGEAQ